MAEKKEKQEKQKIPSWLDAVRKLERAIGVPVESAVTSDAYFDAVTQLKRAQAQIADFVEEASGEVFRLFNLPAGSDIRRMREQLSRMERRLDKLSKEIAAQNGGKPGDEAE
jgi:ubiquinone biosynthesis protein UbiJ